MPTILRWRRRRFYFYSSDGDEPTHVHVDHGGRTIKIWLVTLKVAYNDGYPMREVTAILDVVDRHRERPWRRGMSILTIDDRTLEIADVRCTDEELVVALRDGRKIVAPLWWYPRLYHATPAQRRRWEVAGAGRGIHWPDVDEDLSLEGLLRGAKAPGATQPEPS